MIVAFDTETHLIRPGYTAPRMVCVSLAARANVLTPLDATAPSVEGRVGDISTLLVGRRAGIGLLRGLLMTPEVSLVAQNAAFDLKVLMAADPSLIPLVFEAVEAGRVYCTMLRERLIRNSLGELRFILDRAEGKMRPTMYSLDAQVERYFGVDISSGKSGPDVWRKRYSELDGTPVTEWPTDAVDYAVADSVWALQLLDAQDAAHPEFIGGHATRDPDDPTRFASELRETRAHLALELGATWGLRTEAEAVGETLEDWAATSAEGVELGRSMGFIRPDGTRDLRSLRALVTEAYGGHTEPCIACDGAGFIVTYTKVKKQRREKTCPGCSGAGHVWYGGEAPTTPKGAVQTSEAVLRDSGDELLKKYATSLSATNWLGKYGPILEAGLEHPVTYRVTSMLKSGRTSVAKPPLQQPPRSGGFRGCFVPRPGHLFANADYDRIELCMLAQLCIWWGFGETMADAIRAGMDLHVLMAVDILNAEHHPTPEGYDVAAAIDADVTPGVWTYDVGAACRAGTYGPDWAKMFKPYRDRGKAANFTLPGGGGADTFVDVARDAYGIDLDVDEAKGLKRIWLGRWPEMRRYLARIAQLTEHGEFVAKQMVSGRLRGGCGYTDGANTYFQGLAADGFKAAAWAMAREMYVDRGTALFGSRQVLPLHDEFVVEVPEDRAAEAAERMAEIMRDVMQEHTPDVPIGAEPVLMRRWLKEAEPCRVAGKLVVNKDASASLE